MSEGAARLLVGKDRLQLTNLTGEIRDGLLRPVDHRQPLVQLAQAIVGLPGCVGHREAQLVAHAIQPLVDGAHHVALTVGEHLGHGLHASGNFPLRAQHPGQMLLQFLDPVRRNGLARGPRLDLAQGADHQKGDKSQQKKRGENAGFQQADGMVADDEDCILHETNIERFGCRSSNGLASGCRNAQKTKSRGSGAESFRKRVDRPSAFAYLDHMTKRTIITLPDPVLRQVCEPVAAVGDDIRQLADDMLDTMYDAPGIGLAASQIGVLQRIFVLDVAKEDQPKAPMVFINPEIVWSSPELSVYQEGCLSIPEYYDEVERPASVRVTFQNREGAQQEILADGLLATCIQHELDHLNGKLFIDYLSKLKRDRVVKKFQKQARITGKP